MWDIKWPFKNRLLQKKRLSQFVPNTVRKFFSKRSVFVEEPEENMEDDEE